jgi:hypothetical protein
MKRFSSHLFVAFFTFAISVFGTALFFYQSAKKVELQTSETVVETKIKLPQNSEKVETPKEIEPKSLSPYDIESFIYNNPQADLSILWQKLNISGKFNSLPDWEKNESFLELCSGCEAETFNYNLDDEPGDEVLLRIADNSQESCRYLLFKRLYSVGNSWKLLGFIDHDFGRYQMPRHSFLLSSGKSFLVVQVQTQSGSASLYTDRLFTVQNNKLVELLDYNSGGHPFNFGYQPTREIMGRVISCKIEREIAQIEVEFTAKYTSWDEKSDSEFLLWSKKQKAIYVKSLNSKQKRLDPAKSNITLEEINTIYNIDSSTDKDVLKYNLEELKKVAQEKGNRNQWLREFLQHCENSKEKNILQKIIRK